jgi:hypothetical protein
MVMAIDAMSSRYGLLPGEIMARATTFDLFVYDTAVSYINYAQQKADGKAPEYKQEDLLDILRKNKKNET